MMDDLKDKFGPCGLLCEKCFAFENGPIRHHAERLKLHMGNFTPYAARFVSLIKEPVFAKYADFSALLDYMSSGNCKGCRKQECHLFKDCKVKDCYKGKKVDFCFQCKEFPCNNTGFDDNLQQRWLSINRKIKDIGIDAYYNEIKDKPRY